MSKKLWFKTKKYGWGWTPCSWEGWLLLVGVVIFEIWNFIRIDTYSHSNSDTLRPFIIESIIAFGLLTCICYMKGEKPRWRWGK